MTTLLAIDPGNDTGYAFFMDGKLTMCSVGDPRECPTPDKLIIERPQIYVASKSKGDPNDLITLAIQVGRYMEHFGARGAVHQRTVLPMEWKAQVPKQICAARIHGKLNAQEQGVVAAYGSRVPASIRHNMMDAIGIGLFGLGRARVGMC